MSSLKGTQTEKTLSTAFAGESQARTRYTFFASVAKKEGFEQISAIFMETAEQEKEHAKRFFKFLEGGDLEITATYPAGKIGTTAENLLAAAMGETEEWSEDYPHMAEVALAEGFPQVLAELRLARYLRELRISSGSAETAVMFTQAKLPLKHVLHVFTHRHTSSLKNGISN